MPLLPRLRDSERAGDYARRCAGYALITLALASAASAWLFTGLPDIWARIAPLDGAPFMLAATALGAALAISPLAAVIGFVLALWFGVESVYRPRNRRSPATDRIIVALGLIVWFAPPVGFVGAALRALSEGRVHFVRPPRDYFLATDPIAFWQGVGFWLIMAGLFGFLAWRYWRAKLTRQTV